MSKIYSNIVSENKVREKQKETLQIIADALTKSFGPKGSTTAIVKNMDKNGVNISLDYTKDGHTIVKSIAFSIAKSSNPATSFSLISTQVANSLIASLPDAT